MIKPTGLDAAGFVLLAGGHLRQARELLAKERGPGSRGYPYLLVDNACHSARHALKLLNEKEQPCSKP